MDLLLIDPPWVIKDDDNLWKNVGSCLPSLGIAYIASYLEGHGKSVSIIDCTAEQVSVSSFGKRLRSFRNDPPRFIGITATTALISNALAIAKACKSLFPESKIVLGGVHPSVEPDSTLSHGFVDYVVRDEGEITALELVSGVPLESIDGLSFKRDGQVIHNKGRELIKDLDEIPPPAYHLLPMDRYHPALGTYKRLPAMSIFATRGCPGRCTFCHRTFYGVVRPRSARNIIDEIKLLKEGYGVREIAFYDDTFTLFKKIVHEFCDLLIKERMGITWSCFTRVDYVDEPLLGHMKKAGCHLILFGVESADGQILKNIRKNISLKQVEKIVRVARKIGIETRASFMFGNPGETEETIKKTIDYAIRLDPDEVQFNITTVYPGTEMYDWAKENGYLCYADWSHSNMSDINMRLPTVTHETLRKYYKLGHRRFYLRPKIILRRLLRIRNLAQLAQEVKGGLAVLNIFSQKKDLGGH
jgi:radical SAM superfamily enzyme YgiQ (UPF0313 family)